mmetsp:Transcript_121058/g.337844  ORF Transcript_121058/g.337844 Transcript_121058/m.337844 type:complete len:213 (+) Transcript_121058:83-721(+)
MLLYKLWGAKGANSECLPSIRRLRMSSRSSFSFSSAISLVRMCLRHMGVTTTAIPKPTTNLMVRAWLDWPATAAMPPSKQCSQAKPTRMPRALTRIWIAFAPARESSAPRCMSSTVSRPKTARPAKAESTSAMMTRPMTACSGKKDRVEPIHRVPHSMHQAKAMALPLRLMSRSRGIGSSSCWSPWPALARTSPAAMPAKSRPSPKSVTIAL